MTNSIHSRLFKTLAFTTLITSLPAWSQSHLANQDALRKGLGLNDYPASSTLNLVKLAVLDNGFGNYAPHQPTLPDSAVRSGSPSPGGEDPHGLGMAQIAWAMTGRNPMGPQFYLLNASGFDNLTAAINYAIKQKAGIILYSQTWDTFGNFDGTGFINDAINQATSKGIIWINAAGNIHNRVYNGGFSLDEKTGYVKLPGEYNTLRFKNKLDANHITVLLSWNDFTGDKNRCSTKGLNLMVYNDQGTLVSPPSKIQNGSDPDKLNVQLRDAQKKAKAANQPIPDTLNGIVPDDYSCYARQQFDLQLDSGNYAIRIQPQGDNFGESDKFRVVVKTEDPYSIDFSDHSSDGEIGVAADNPNVITVGDCSDNSAVGPTVDGREKPDVVIPQSEADFTDGKRPTGSSNAAAMFAGIVAEMMAQEPTFNAANLKDYIQSLRDNPDTRYCGRAPIWRTPTPTELTQFVH